MKNVLIIAHNRLSVDFWRQYLSESDFSITILRNVHIDSLRSLKTEYDITIFDLYFNASFLDEDEVENYAKNVIALNNLGKRYFITSAVPECEVLNVKIMNFGNEFIKLISQTSTSSKTA